MGETAEMGETPPCMFCWKKFASRGQDTVYQWLMDDKGGAEILLHYLKLKDDNADRAQTVKLDRRVFRHNFSALKNTKTIGW